MVLQDQAKTMNNELSLFNRIIFGDLRPWLAPAIHEDKYKSLSTEIKAEIPRYTPLYKVEFPKHFNPKTKYYSSLIQNETIIYLNNIHLLLSDSKTDNLKEFWTNTTLSKKLEPQIKDIKKIILEKEFSIDNLVNLADIELKSNTYIIQLLKVELIYLYLEIQKAYIQHVRNDILEISDIYSNFLNESAPITPFITIESTSIKENINTVVVNELIKPKEEITKPVFIPIKGDIKREKKNKSKFTFEDLKDPKLFIQFETFLHEYGFINIEYNYIEDHGRKTELAAIYQVLISKNYFRAKSMRRNKYEPYHYRQFLDHRYNTDVAYQFKTITSEQMDSVTSKYHWLHSLPVCR